MRAAVLPISGGAEVLQGRVKCTRQPSNRLFGSDHPTISSTRYMGRQHGKNGKASIWLPRNHHARLPTPLRKRFSPSFVWDLQGNGAVGPAFATGREEYAQLVSDNRRALANSPSSGFSFSSSFPRRRAVCGAVTPRWTGHASATRRAHHPRRRRQGGLCTDTPGL